MGLFKKKTKRTEPEVPIEVRIQHDMLMKMLDPDGFQFHFPESEDDITVECSVPLNLTEKAVKVYVPESGLPIREIFVAKDGDVIRGTEGEAVIFEINKRSKAYKELEPFTDHKARDVYISKKQSDYGSYYRAHVRFDIVVEL